MVKVAIRFVDGGFDEFNENNSFGERLIELQEVGYEGKELIHTLLTDDWGAPPTIITITGTLSSGKKIDVSIPYR